MKRISRRPSISRLTATQRLRSSWTRWSLARTQRRLEKETRRLQLMQVQLDSQLLLLKRLDNRLLGYQQEQQELVEIRSYRLAEPLELEGPTEEQLRAELLA